MNLTVLQESQNILSSLAVQFEMMLKSLPTKDIATMLSLSNIYLFKVGRSVEMISEKDTNGQRSYDSDAAAKAFEEDLTVIFPMRGIQTLIKKYWEQFAHCSMLKLLEARRRLAEFGLFKLWDRTAWKDNPKLRTRAVNQCREWNQVRATIFVDVAEKELKSRGIEVFPPLPNEIAAEITSEQMENNNFPEHKAYTNKAVADAGFRGGIWVNGRDGVLDENGVIVFSDDQYADCEPHPEVIAAIAREVENPLSNHVPVTAPEERQPESDPEISREEWVEKHQPKPTDTTPYNNIKPKPKKKAVEVVVPNSCWHESLESLDWWERIKKSASWLLKFAPDWVLEKLVDF